MSGELSIFTNEEFGEVRGIEVNGDAWLVGEDVVNRLKYDTSKNSYSKYIKRYCDEEDFVLYDAKTQVQNGLQFDYKELGQRGGYLINESGMYSLVFGSKLPSAKKFKHWVTSEVLPSIRKHGAYMTENTIEKALTSPDFLIQLATKLKEEQEARKKAEATIEEQKPLVSFANTVTESSDCLDMGEFAKVIKDKDINMGRNKLFQWLRDNKYLMNNNVPYQKYIDNGVFKVIEVTKKSAYDDGRIYTKTLVTGKGQVYILEKLKEECA